jgi:hypothetical protein
MQNTYASFVSHIENFLNVKVDSEIEGQYTIKFFKKDQVQFQNSLLVDPINKTILDMKISDKDIFEKVSSTFGEHNDKNSEILEIATNINLYEFLAKILGENTGEYAVIGFVSHIKNGPNQERLPGSQCLNYVII